VERRGTCRAGACWASRLTARLSNVWVVCQVQAPAVALGFKTEVRLGRAQQSAFVSRVAAQSTTVSPLSPSSYWPGLGRHWRGTGPRAAGLGGHAAGWPGCAAGLRRRCVQPLGCWDAQHMRGAAALNGLPHESRLHNTPAVAQGTVGAKQVTECKGKKLNVAINGFGRIGMPALLPGRLTAHGACTIGAEPRSPQDATSCAAWRAATTAT
jgi:hypothetical protein